MRDGESTPLLAKAAPPSSAPSLQAPLPLRSLRRAKSKHLRDINDPTERRRGYGGDNNNAHSSENDDDDDDDEEEEDEYSEDGLLHLHHRQPKPATDSALLPIIHPLGAATRKPRWTGIRSKIAAVGVATSAFSARTEADRVLAGRVD